MLRPLDSPVFSASVPVQAISFALTYKIPVSGSAAGPPHSAPPSNPGNITVAFPTLKVPIPQVVSDALKMPNPLARLRVQCNQAVREQIVSRSIGAIEIESCGTRGNVDDTALEIDGHPRPVVCCAAGFPGFLRPRLVAELPGVRDGVKRPAQFARAHVVGANVARRRRQGFRFAAAYNQHILINDARARQSD